MTDGNQKLPSSSRAIAWTQGAVFSMDYIDNLIDKLKEWARKIIEALLGPEAEPEPEPIPIPVNEPRRRR